MGRSFLFGAFLLLGCEPSNGGSADGGVGGSVEFIVESETSITDGVESGPDAEAIQDGWAVTFEEYVVVIGGLDVRLSTDPTVRREASSRVAIDLTEVPTVGTPIARVDGLPTGRWDLRYAIGPAAETARDASVSPERFDELVASGWTYFIAATMVGTDGQSCPPAGLARPAGAIPNGNTNAAGDACYANPSISFAFGIEAPTVFGPCEVDDIPGFAVADGATTTVSATIHGDHLFFNGFPEGGEGGVQRLAQWLADCDLDLDGTVTRAELESLAPADLVEIDARFQLGGSSITPLSSLWDYVSAQAKTQGHFQGEGECALDGSGP